MVLCCLFLVSGFWWRFTLRVFMLFLVRFGLLGGRLFEVAARSVGHVFSLCFDYLWFCLFPVFCFWGWVWVLFASVPGLCILFAFIGGYYAT